MNTSSSSSPHPDALDANASLHRLRTYLQCNTAHPQPDFTSAMACLSQWAHELHLTFDILTSSSSSSLDSWPVVVLTWPGTSRDRRGRSLLFNSHMDVVPVVEEETPSWTCPPFEGQVKGSFMYGRGIQDMKSVGVQYLEALRWLKVNFKYSPKHTLYFTFMPDEEIGSVHGMATFIHHFHSPKMREEEEEGVSLLFHETKKKETNATASFLLPKCVLDEGLAYEKDEGYHVFYGERVAWWVKVKVKGTTGHGSLLLENTAGPKLHRILARFEAFRDEQVRKLNEAKKPDGSKYTLGDLISVNLTLLQGGVQFNVLPEHLEMGFDVRIPPSVDAMAFKSVLEGWCFCEEGVEVEYTQFSSTNPVTSFTDPPAASYYQALHTAANHLNLTLFPSIFPATTDARFFRALNVPVFGISPMRNTPVLLHQPDERLDIQVFLEGIQFYVHAIQALDQVQDEVEEG